MSTKFAVVAVWAEDVAANTRFYHHVLGLELLPHSSQPHFRVQEVTLTIRQGVPVTNQNADRFPLFALAVDELDPMVTRLEQHHIALPWGIESSPEARWVMFRDPAGNLIELVELAAPQKDG